MCLEGSKIKAQYFRQFRLYDDIESFEQTLKTHIFVKCVNEYNLAVRLEQSL